MNQFVGARIALWAGDGEELADIEKTLLGLGARTQAVRSAEQMEDLLESQWADLIIASLRPSFQSPLHLLARRRESRPLPPVVVVTDMMDINLYLEAIQRSAYDGLGLPLDKHELIRIAGRALEAFRLFASAPAA